MNVPACMRLPLSHHEQFRDALSGARYCYTEARYEDCLESLDLCMKLARKKLDEKKERE